MNLTTVTLPLEDLDNINPMVLSSIDIKYGTSTEMHDTNNGDTLKHEKFFSYYEHQFTEDKITECVINCGFEPKPEFVKLISKKIYHIDIQERAMFLAQIIHESAGLREIEELEYKGNKMAPSYNHYLGKEGKSYHGRGFIQLSWPHNYLAASEYLNLGDSLLLNPELVCEDIDIAWGVTEYYWVKNVSPHFLVQKKMFWPTTFCINGFLECDPGKRNEAAETRWKYYEFISKIMGEKNPANKGLEELNEAIINERREIEREKESLTTDSVIKKHEIETKAFNCEEEPKIVEKEAKKNISSTNEKTEAEQTTQGKEKLKTKKTILKKSALPNPKSTKAVHFQGSRNE